VISKTGSKNAIVAGVFPKQFTLLMGVKRLLSEE
jgi:hypothetical protein